MPLVFLGLGIHGVEGIPLVGLQTLKASDEAYLEKYTSPISEETLSELNALVDKEVMTASREFVEDGRILLDHARKDLVVLVVPGDPMIATTHSELATRCRKLGIETRTIHNSSVLTALAGEIGLHAYNFGKPVTITQGPPASMATVYSTLHSNLTRYLHTVLLIQYDVDSSYFVPPNEAIASLLETEKSYRWNAFRGDSFVIVASRLGMSGQTISAGQAISLSKESFGPSPHSIVVPGRLHFTETEAISAVAGIKPEEIVDNASSAISVAQSLLPGYVEKTRKALVEATNTLGEKKEKFASLFENVDLYASDAERFLQEGKGELAFLSIGYAEGLLDALRFTGELEIQW